CGQRTLCPQLGHQRRLVRSRPLGPVARRDVVTRSRGTTVAEDFPGSHQATVHSTSAEGFNSRELRNALGSFATGVTIITTRDRDGKLHGMTANSFSSVSLTPPLVLWSASLYAQSLPAFQEGNHFVVNILAYDQIELSNKFAKQSDDKFIDVEHIIPESGAPVISGAAA